MPYQVQVGAQVVEFPDSVSQNEAQRILADQFPATGEDIAGAMQDPAFTPTQEDYLKFEQFSKTKQTDWINTAAQAADAAIGMISGAVSQGAQGAAANPLNYIEGFAQGTRQLYGLAAQSQDPSSPLFKFKDLVAGSGTPESRYQQFLEARDFANTTARLERGEEGVWVPPEYTNPEYVQGVSMILDPTLFVPGVGEILGAGKLATRAVGKGAQLTGRAVAGAARPLERVAGAAERMTAEALGMTPEALRTAASTAGIAGALGIAPEAAAFAAIPAGIRTAREAGEALAMAGENLMTQPSRIGPLEAIGAAPGANLRQRMLGVVGQYGGDAALDASLRGLAGGIEGGVIGTGLGYLSGGEEGAAAGLGAGAVQGAAGAIGGRAYQKLTGKAAAEARAGDLGRFIDSQQDPTTKALFERVRDTHGVDTASALMDVEGLVKGRFGDVDVKYLSDTDFVDQYKGRARGVQVEVGDRPTIVINADILGKGKGDSPLYTLGHELFHALEKSEQLAGGATEIKNALVGRWIQEGDIIRKLADGAFNDAEIEARFNEYRDKLSAGSPQRAAELAQFDTINKKADYIASELAAEHFAALIAGQKPDAMLKGFSGLTRQLLDAALTQNASKAIANAAASIERTFGVKPTDSVLFPDLKQASPQVNAMLRDLVRARRKLDEKIMLDDSRGGRVLKPEDVSNPLAAKELVDLGLAEQMPDGSIRNLSSDEIRARDDKDLTSLRSITEKIPGARMVDGEITGRFSPDQLSAIEQSQTISSRMKDKIRAVNLAIENGNSLFVTYFAALKRVRNKLTKKYSPKYDSGIRVSEREFSPYSFKITKADNPVVNAIDITKVRNELSKLLKKDGSIGGLWNNTDGFMTDLARYFTNLDQREGARRSAEIFGVEKAKFLGDFVGAAEKGGSKFVRSFRLDRVGSMSPMDFKAKFSEEAYQLSKQRWMPAETIGDKSVINSDEGYRIISGAKHKLYGPDGKLIGIYDTQTQAERKADATQARLQPEVRQQQYPARDEVRQAAEAGRGDSALGRTQGREEGRQELGTVRQAGDVITPESPDVAKKVVSGDTSTLKDGELLGTFRFMPPDLIDKLAVTDQQRKAMRGKSGFAFVSDWADAGRPYVTRLGRKIDVLMGGMGYPFLPEISGKGAWAGTFSGMTDKVMDKIKATDGIGLVVLGGPESSASSRAFSRAFGEELADSISQNPKLKEKLDKISRNARKQWIEYRRGEGRSINVPEINSLEDWARLTQLERSGEQSERGLTFNDRDFLVRTIGSHDNKKALGIRSWKDVLRNYNLQNKDFTPGQVVAVVQFSGAEPVRAETIGAKPHPSYEALIPGKAIGTLPQKTMIKDVFRDFLSKTQPPAFTRKVQTNMPKFVVGEGDMRFMPVDENTGLPLNPDKTVTVYHHTNKTAAEAIRRTGVLKSAGEPDVYVTTEKSPTTGYGDEVVAIKVDPKKLQIDDQFPDGRTDFRLSVGKPSGSMKVTVDSSERFMPSSLTARDINAIAAEVGGGDVKGGAKAFGAFMRSMRDKGITLRDVVKSYGITLSSIQRQELPVSTIKKNWPDAPFQEGTKVRPEDAFAQLLGTPEGQQYLNAAERGVFDEQAADAVVQKFRSFGFHNKLKEQMKTAVEQFYPKAQEIIDAVNSMPTDQFIDYVRNNFKGISYGKVGFWSGQLGRGDIPTFDSRQGKLVYGKEVPVTKQVLMEQKDRLTQLGINVPAAFKDFAQTLLHHEVWDRLNQSDTEHGPIKEAMLRFMPDYSGEHKAPQRDYGAPLDNLKGVYPDDVYGPNAARYYGHSSGDATDKAAARIIQATKGKPDAPVKVFRAIPKSIQSNEINPGDWITTIKSYAVQHGEGPLGGDYKILEKTVPAGDLYTNGDSIFEFGYDPKFMPSPDSAMPGAYSFPGGYRALPGKTKGSLRIYGPAGSLIGIAASLDEAQRIIRKKAKQ